MTKQELEAIAEDWIRGTAAFETKKARIEAVNMYVQAFLTGRDSLRKERDEYRAISKTMCEMGEHLIPSEFTSLLNKFKSILKEE